MPDSIPPRRNRSYPIAALPLILLPLLTLLVSPPRPSRALPMYSRRYKVPCETCHSIAPRLTNFGLAFQANHFLWPKESAPARHSGLSAFPISGLATLSSARDISGHKTETDFNALELFASDGFTIGGATRPGGYFIDYVAAVTKARAGDLEYAFVSVPIAGKNGQWAVTAGQFAPMSYQYDGINSLTQSQPAALGNELDAFTLTDPLPGVRVEFFNHRNQSSPDGDYVSLGTPIGGHLALNGDARLDDTTHGVYAHAFRRWGQETFGLFGYTRAGNHLEGVMGTKDIGEALHLLGIVSTGHDDAGNTDRLSLQAEYVVSPMLGFTGRLESVHDQGQDRSTYPVGTVTFYPFREKVIRLGLETSQAKSNRSLSAYLIGQY